MSESDFKQEFAEGGVPGRNFTYEIIEEKIDDETWRGIKATAKLSEKEASELIGGDANTMRLTITKEKFEELFGEKNPIEENGLSDIAGGSVGALEVEGLHTAETSEENGENEDVMVVLSSPVADDEASTDTNLEEGSTDDFSKLEELSKAAEHLSMTFKITMPNEPETNIGKVDGKTVIIDMMSEEYKNTPAIIITCEAPISWKSNKVLIAGLVGGFLVFVGALVFVSKKFSD